MIGDLLFRAITEAYKDTLMVGKYPFFVLFLDLDPSVVDFNVHPQKLQVRFEKESYIYNKLYNIIRSFVEDKFIAKEAKYLSTELSKFTSENETGFLLESEIEEEKSKAPLKKFVKKERRRQKIRDYQAKKFQLKGQFNYI